MRRSRFTEEQIIGALKEHEMGASPKELCRRLGIATETLYNWKRKYDGLGSTSAVTDANGNSTDTYDYDAFGATRSSTGTSDQPFRFTGEYQDVDVGEDRYYLRARLYDPALGRFLTQDPLPSGQAYAYAGNNPANFVDPSGLFFHGKVLDVISNVGDWLLGATYSRRARITIAAESIFRNLSSGDAIQKEGGITLINNCRGLCEAIDNTAFTIGHTIFNKAQTIRAVTLAHERRHVRQYEVLGDLFWWIYIPNKIGAAAFCLGDESCYRRYEIVERLAGPS